MKKKFLAVLSCGLAATFLFGCSNNASQKAETTAAQTEAAKESQKPSEETAEKTGTDTASEGGMTFGVTYWIESDFFKTVADSITKAAEAEGNKTVVVDAQQDSTKQLQVVEDFIAQDVDAVFLNPVDKDAIEPALQKLDEAGIPVVNFDSAVGNLDLVDAYVATDNIQAGKLCGEAMLKDFPDGGKIAVLNYPANSACVDREKGFLETIEGKGFEIVETFDAEGTVEKGQNLSLIHI